MYELVGFQFYSGAEVDAASTLLSGLFPALANYIKKVRQKPRWLIKRSYFLHTEKSLSLTRHRRPKPICVQYRYYPLWSKAKL
jgi:hypothetical protein